jgi:hypothetical protein
MLAQHRSTAHHTSDSNNETPTRRTPYPAPLSCNRRELAPLRFEFRGPSLSSGSGRGRRLVGIPEVVGMLLFGADVGFEYIVAPFVVSRPSTPLSLAKPTEPVTAPVAVVSYLGRV